MQSVDINQSKINIDNRLKSIKTYVDLSKSEKQSRRETQNSFQKSTSDLANQLNKITEEQKRYQRNLNDKMSEMTNFIKSIGSGANQSQSLKYLRKKILETATKIEPQIQEIIQKAALKSLGCSEEQTYPGINAEQLKIQLETQGFVPEGQGIFIPVQSIDLLGSLKKEPNSNFGKYYYEKEEVSADPGFRPYGGDIAFPMNRLLNLLMDENNQGRFLSQIIGKPYNGISLQPLFDIRYTTTNEFGVSGNFFEVVLLDRENENGNIDNSVGSFAGDYFRTIKLTSPIAISSMLIEFLSGGISMSEKSGFDEIANKTKFGFLIKRILGLCFDSKSEIDVSGVAKIAELDGVDDTFFDLNEIDLRNLDLQISNIQNGVMEFVDCNNVKLPVDYQNLTEQLIKFRDEESEMSDSEKTEEMEKVLDSISQNPTWSNLVPPSLQVGLSLNQSTISQLPVAVTASILSPKTLLPIFSLLAIVQNKASVTYNEAITANNTLVDPVNNLSNETNNNVADASDFLKKFKSFNIEVISGVSQIFLKTLFDILKKDILNLLQTVIGDIGRTRLSKKYAAILRLLQFAIIISRLIQDFRKCKNLLDNIESIINLINGVPNPSRNYPEALLLFAPLLPGVSPERGTINSIQLLQSLGIDTGPNTDGSPNLMLQFLSSTIKGYDQEVTENGKIEGFGINPVVGRVDLFAKPV